MFKIKVTLIIISLLFNSCASLNERNVDSTYVEAFNSIKGAIFGFEDAVITKDLVENIPYASAKLKIGNNKNSRKIKRRKHNTRKLKIGKKLKTSIKYRRKKNDTRRKKIIVNTKNFRKISY